MYITSAYVSALFNGQGGSLFPSISLFPTASTSTGPSLTVQQAEAGKAKGIAAEAKDPSVSRDVAAFRRAVASAKDLKSLLADPTARKVFLTANGLADQVDYTALVTKALSSDLTDQSSLANKLTDTRYKAIAAAFDFAKSGLVNLKKPSVLDTIASGYEEVAWRKSLDVNTPGLSTALDFHSRASSITSTLQILGDSTLRKVVTTALGLPLQIAVQPLEAQQAAIQARLDVTQFKDPKFVDKFIQRFLSASAQNAATAAAAGTAAPVGVLSLFA